MRNPRGSGPTEAPPHHCKRRTDDELTLATKTKKKKWGTMEKKSKINSERSIADAPVEKEAIADHTACTDQRVPQAVRWRKS
jgi:hypothetical protein